MPLHDVPSEYEKFVQHFAQELVDAGWKKRILENFTRATRRKGFLGWAGFGTRLVERDESGRPNYFKRIVSVGVVCKPLEVLLGELRQYAGVYSWTPQSVHIELAALTHREVVLDFENLDPRHASEEPSRLAYEVQTVGWERILEICTYQGLLEALFENLSATVPSDAFDAWVRIPTLLVLMGRTDEAFEFIQGPESSKQRPRTVTELEAALQAYVDQVPKSAE